MCSISHFLPHLTQDASPLRELAHKETVLVWTDIHDNAFHEIKKMTCESPLLGHYDPNAPLVLQTDASSHGLDAVTK